MEHLTESTFFITLLQATLLAVYIPISYFGYRWVRVPLKHDRIRQSLSQLGIVQTEKLEEVIGDEYHLKHYIWPLFGAFMLTFATYIFVHPYFIQRGLVAGIFEEVINIFGADDLFPKGRAMLAGRFLFWGWLGALTYSFHLTFRRFLAYDLTPSVYIFTFNRFFLAITVGAIVGLGMGTFSTAAGVPFDVNMATVSIIAFFIGFFPEQGINWITATAQKWLKQQGGVSKETRLSEIEGLSMWHQGRLKQEGLDNVQNLATADVPALIVGTPFTINQIIDWVDQAILLIHTNGEQFENLEKAGVIRASDVLTTTSDQKRLQSLSNTTGLGEDELKVLHLSLQSALNIRLVARFRWQSSLDEAKVEEATAIQPPQTTSAVALMPREQEAMMLEAED